MSFPDLLKADAARVEARLMAAMAGFADVPVVQAMRYAAAGGKRLRGFLVLESARMLGVAPERAISAAAAVEALHAYSLVHDDLPCMDDDDLRRGLPTVHVKWDEATAVLAGDALQTLAFELLCDPALGGRRCGWRWCRRWRWPVARKAWCWGRRWTLPPRRRAAR